MGRRLAAGEAADDQRHRRQTVDPQDTRRRRAEIDHSPVHEWTAIVDANDRGAAIAAIDHSHFGPERQRTMGAVISAGFICSPLAVWWSLYTDAMPDPSNE